mgnify:CR=1 FL=1
MVEQGIWFEKLFGFKEGNYHWTQSQFNLSNGQLESLHNGRSYRVGRFSTPTVAELRARVKNHADRSTLSHKVIGDALDLHADPKNAGDMFQVASQFNALEFASAEATPEDGITRYAYDRTQGPACALAAAAGTVYRNYFIEIEGRTGQTQHSQINNLETLEKKLAGGPYWQVKNGYTDSTQSLMRTLASELEKYNRNDLVGAVRLGLQEQTQVTFSNRFNVLKPAHFVSQVFCSAISCAYSRVEISSWEPLARIVLEAAYEGTLLAAAADRDNGTGTGKVWLTFLGGGVFGNDDEWIAASIEKALERTKGLGLDIRICHFRELQSPYSEIAI